MRALCGAIITAGALIGLGLTVIGIGTRYQADPSRKVIKTETTNDGKAEQSRTEQTERVIMHLGDIDRPLIFALVFLTCATIIGLGITFLGLAYHHARREREHTLHSERWRAESRTTPSNTGVTG